MRILIYPYKMYSKSGKILASALNTKRLRPEGRYRSRYYDLVINWGNTTIPYWYARILNKPEAVKKATNKLESFKLFKQHNVPTPEWTEDFEEAKNWVQQGNEVYCRQDLSGHSGSGIVVCSTVETMVSAPLFTKRVKAKYEFRVHVFKGQVIDFQQKKRRNGVETSGRIRNHGHGYIYARSEVCLPSSVENTSISAVAALGLDFGAVDIGYKASTEEAFAYEVNTAPGLVGTTIDRYKQAILSLENQNV